jgi:hypothetical protein
VKEVMEVSVVEKGVSVALTLVTVAAVVVKGVVGGAIFM